MKISYNPKSSQAAITPQTAANDDIIFDLYASKLWAKGTRIGADWADISSKPSSLKNPHALTISLNGTSQGPYDGSAAKNINITPSSIGAATSGHNHDGRYVYNYGGTSANGQTLNQNALFMSTTSGITGDWWHILQAAWNGEYRWNSQIAFPTQNRNGMYYRSGLDDNTKWGSWIKLLDVGNSSISGSTITLNGSSITVSKSDHNHDNRYVRKWTGVYGNANKFLKLVIGEEKGWIRLEVSDSNNSLSGGYGIYIIGWGWHGNDNIDNLKVKCLYSNDSRYIAALKVVRTSRNNYDFYFQFASDSSYPSYTINYSSSVSSIDCTVTAVTTIPTATWTSSLSALQLNASQVDWSGITNKPSVFNPAAHTHTVFNNNLMIKGTNGISDSASIHLGIGDSDTGFKWISDGKCQIYANNVAVGEWTSGGMNWFKNPTVNGNKIWNAGNDGPDSGLDADTVDGVHVNQLCRIYTFFVHNSIIKVGTLTSGQLGHVCKLRFNSGIGYSANNTDKTMTVVIRASNGNANSNGFYFESHSESYRGGAFTTFYLHQTSKTQCELYMDAFNYSGQSTYEVSFSAGDSWVNEISVQDALPTSNILTLPNYQIAYTNYNVASATKLQTPRNLWGNSFDGTKDINGSIIFPNIGDTATSNKISWNGSSDGADIYYQTTATDQGNLVLNVKDDTNAYIQLALNGTFKSHFDVANSYWTGRSAQADKWTTARTFTIGNTTKNVDGSGNVSWSLSEIGVRDTWRTVQVNGTSIGNNTLNLCGSTYIGLTNVNGKVTFSLVGSGTTANQAILSNGTANGWTLKTLNIANWDTAYNFVSTITGEDADKVINKWDEIVNFLAGITEDNKLNTLLNSKLSVYKLADNTNVGAIKNNGIYYSTTDASSGTLTNSPFNTGFALINITSYDGGDDLRRSRLAFNAYGEIKVSDDRDYANTTETWYNVLTSKNSGISGSTIKLNGTSITVYSSGAADGRYVKKSGDTMTGALNFANNAWNNVGDDVAIGDHNEAGCLGIKGLNAGPGIAFYNSSNTLLSKLVGTANQFQRVSGNNTYNILDNSTTHINDNTITINGTSLTVSKSDHNHDNKYLRLDGSSTMTGQIKSSYSAGTWINGLTNAILKATSDGYNSLICAPIKSGNICISAWTNEEKLNFGYAIKGKTDNSFDTRMYWDAPNNNLHAAAFTGHLYGTADNATNSDKLDGYHANGLLTALSNSNRGISLTIGGTTKSLSNISVGDADTVDGLHASAFTRIVGRYSINTNGTAPYRYIHLFRIANSMGYSTVDCEIDLRTRYHSAKLEIRITTPQYPYGENGSSISIIKKVINGRSCNLLVLKTVQSSNYNYYDIYYESGSYNFGGYDIILRGSNGTLVFEHKGTNLDVLPSNTSVVNNQWVMWNDIAGKPTALKNPHTIKFKNTANAVITYDGSSDVDLTGGINYANSAGSATKVIVNQHTTNDINYPLVWSNQNNANNVTENQLFKSWDDLYYNPKNKRLFVRGSVNTANINATGTVTSAGFKHSGVTENADQYVLTAGGGYTFLNQASNELAHEFSKDITVTSEWTDIEDFYGGNQNFLTQPGTYIVQVYYNDNSADGMYEGYFSGIMSWFTGTTNSNNADEIVLHRVGHAYANTIYLRTRESLESETNPYTKLQISANTTLKQHTYKFKFKRIC